MCGIAGICDFGSSVDRDLVRRMTDAVAHRGPDDSGLFFDEDVGLGHRRLSVIDVDGGAQPMSTANGRLTIVYNGELYNYRELRNELIAEGCRFLTRSDTEVVLLAYERWGRSCLGRLNGMFAFGIWDSVDRRLVLARDPLGIKPLYFHCRDGRILFGSEIKALLEDASVTRAVEPRALGLFLALRYVPSPLTMLRGIHKLSPGHCLVAGNTGWSVNRYWRRPPTVLKGIDEREAEWEYRRLLDRAVERQMLSDVPVGLFLSGGVDSALLLALMKRHTSDPLETFTVSFPGRAIEDESEAASAVARRFGAHHRRVQVGADEHLSLLEQVSWHLEEPITTTSIVPYFALSGEASQSLKVVLTGQGADEPWAGYSRYLGEKLTRLGRFAPRSVRRLAARLADVWPGRGETVPRGLRALQYEGDPERFSSIYALFTDSERRSLIGEGFLRDMPAPETVFRSYLQEVDHLDSLSKMLYIDTRVWLPDDLLLYGDKLSMAHGLESRVPFLDLELLQFVERLPIRLKLRGTTGKYLHRRVASQLLPPGVLRRRKQGFASPLDGWLSGKLNRKVVDLLLGPSAQLPAYVGRKEIARLVDQHSAGHRNRQRQLFSLISLEAWHRVFIGSQGD